MEKKLYCTVGFYVLIASVMASCFLLYELVELNLIPVVWIGLILLLLLCLGFFLLFKHKILGNILLVLIVCISSFGGYYIHKTNVALERVAMPSTAEAKFMVVSLKENESIQKLGVSSKGNVKLQDVAISKLDQEYEVVEYDSYYALGDALYDRSVDAILVSDISYEMLDGDLFETFVSDSEIVQELVVKVDSSLPSIPVDVTDTPFTVYISGHDLGGYSTAFSHSDVNILMTINPKTHQILMLGLPRDSYIPQTEANNQKDKLTHTGLYGAKCIVDSVSNFLEVPINYYVEVNFNSLVDIVDALGGVTVDSPFEFSSFGFDFVKGKNELDGERALAFARERYSFEDGDKERSRNQMRVLHAIIDKAMSPSIIQNYPELMKTLSDSFKSNMNQKEMTSFIRSQIKDLKDWDIQQIQIGGTGIMIESPALGFEVYMMDPDMDTVHSATTLIKRVLKGKNFLVKILQHIIRLLPVKKNGWQIYSLKKASAFSFFIVFFCFLKLI